MGTFSTLKSTEFDWRPGIRRYETCRSGPSVHAEKTSLYTVPHAHSLSRGTLGSLSRDP